MQRNGTQRNAIQLNACRFLVRRGEPNPAARAHVRHEHLRVLLQQPVRVREDHQDTVLVRYVCVC